MMAWGDIEITAVADKTGDLTQLYPKHVPNGSVATTSGALRRHPREGAYTNITVETDGTHGGEIEIWDINGEDAGANVNTALAITNAQLTTAQALGKAKILWSQKFAGTATVSARVALGTPFTFGLAARFIAAAGTCYISVNADGGYVFTEISG